MSGKTNSKTNSANSFRPNAGVVILGGNTSEDPKGDDLVLAFRRTGTDAWQFPQGGIDPGETPIDAMWRELEEETRLTGQLVDLVAEVPEWLGYEIPEEFRRKKLSRGQVQKWFFVQVKTNALESVEQILEDLPPEEFDGWKWTTFSTIADEVIEFRQPIYRRLAQYLQSVAR